MKLTLGLGFAFSNGSLMQYSALQRHPASWNRRWWVMKQIFFKCYRTLLGSIPIFQINFNLSQ